MNNSNSKSIRLGIQLLQPVAILLLLVWAFVWLKGELRQQSFVTFHIFLTATVLWRMDMRLRKHMPRMPIVDPSIATLGLVFGLVNMAVAVVVPLELSGEGKLVWGINRTFLAMALLFPGLLLLMAERVAPSEDSDEDVLTGEDIPADFDDAPMGAMNLLMVYIFVVIRIAFVIAYVGVLIFGFTIYFNLLKDVFIRDVEIHWDRLLGRLIEALPTLANNLLPIVVVILSLVLLVAVGHVIFRILQWIFRRNETRQLSHREIAFVEDAHRTLVEHYESGEFAVLNAREKWGWVAVFIALMTGGFVVIFLISECLGQFQKTAIEAQFDWVLMLSDGQGVSLLLGIFAIIFCLGFIAAYAVKFFPSMPEKYALADENYGGGLEQAKAHFPAHKVWLIEFVRAQKINADDAFDPKQFYDLVYHRFDWFFRWPTFVLLPLTLVTGYLDYQQVEFITQEEIVIGDYWTGRQYSYSFDDIEYVDIDCRGSDDSVILSYDIVLPAGQKVDLFDANLRQNLEKIEEVDRIVVAHDIMFKAVPFTNFLGKTFRYDRQECLSALSEDYRPEQAERILPLLHLDALEVVE